MRFIFILLVSTILTGCAGSIAGDALAGPEKLAQQDDTYCQSIGTRFGTTEYATCRENATARREAHHAQGRALAAAGLAIAATSPPSPSLQTANETGLRPPV